jgi:hypothetical protein
MENDFWIWLSPRTELRLFRKIKNQHFYSNWVEFNRNLVSDSVNTKFGAFEEIHTKDSLIL